jgi:tRNA-modifying protein YgfZ
VVGEDFAQQLSAIEEGSARLDLEGWTVTEVRGSDALPWLQDLVTASIEGLEPGRTVRSLLLSPTGRIRADFHVLRRPSGHASVLLQSPGQPTPLVELLSPYVLSSDVDISGAAGEGLFVTPSPGPRWSVREAPPGIIAGEEAYEVWRIRHGIARFPVDLDTDSLPAEAALDEPPVIDRTKGCYLGQESVARVRNLGHPPRVLLSVRADTPLASGTPVVSHSLPSGIVTSAEHSDGGACSAIVRIRWEARESELATPDGTRLEPL